jgi:heme exporter protein B
LIDLLRKEFALELRRKSVLAGISLYLISTSLICYLSFSLRHTPINEPVWSALLWMVTLFTVANASAKSFLGEKPGTEIYFYHLVSAGSIILSKIIYNFALSVSLALSTFLLFIFFFDNPVEDILVFSVALFLGAGALASTLTTISSIASKASNSSVLISVLGLPVVTSILLPVIKLTRNAIDGLDWSVSQPDLLVLLAINCLIVAVSYLVFPYIWRS